MEEIIYSIKKKAKNIMQELGKAMNKKLIVI